MPTICSVARGEGRYDYFRVGAIPRRRMGKPGLAPLAGILPLLPLDATPDGSGEVARGVVCTRGGDGLGDASGQGVTVTQLLVGLVFVFLLTRGAR